VLGEAGMAALGVGLFNLAQGGAISEHDQRVAGALARVLCGGPVPIGTRVSEQRLLDLEREAFVSLCGEPKTQARMKALLETGRPLRN
jgi:3-hydroxyacyl-CoA dehydrogenase